MGNIKTLIKYENGASNVFLRNFVAKICIGGSIYFGEGAAYLELSPNSNIVLRGKFKDVPENDAIKVIFGKVDISSFSVDDSEIAGFVIKHDYSKDKIFSLTWCPCELPMNGVGSETMLVTQVSFHLFNFIRFTGTQRTIENEDCIGGSLSTAIQHTALSSDEWIIDLQSLSSTDDNIKTTFREGSCRLTHVGRIARNDNRPFCGKDAQECLDALKCLLSFVSGSWCTPVCLVGVNAEGEHVWESWTSPLEPNIPYPTWFDAFESNLLPNLFSKFMEKWKDESWRQTIREIIYWYINAKQPSLGKEAAIILTQAAIERLSYEFSVNHMKLISSEGFDKLRASDKFRLLFSSLSVPLNVPDETPVLSHYCSANGILDAPHALTKIRNNLVHPDPIKRAHNSKVHLEAWKLSLWFLEMGLLAVCGYSGKYKKWLSDSYWSKYEKVPWNKGPKSSQ